MQLCSIAKCKTVSFNELVSIFVPTSVVSFKQRYIFVKYMVITCRFQLPNNRISLKLDKISFKFILVSLYLNISVFGFVLHDGSMQSQLRLEQRYIFVSTDSNSFRTEFNLHLFLAVSTILLNKQMLVFVFYFLIFSYLISPLIFTLLTFSPLNPLNYIEFTIKKCCNH